MRCEGIDHGCIDWDYEKEEKIGQWNGKMIQTLDADLAIQCIYQDATKMSSNTTARVYLVEDTHGNDSFNPPSSEANSEPRNNITVDVHGFDDKRGRRAEFEAEYSRSQRDRSGNETRVSAKGSVSVDERGKVESKGSVSVSKDF